MASSFAALSILSSPLLERQAFAQPQPEVSERRETPQRDVRFEVAGTQLPLRNGDTETQAYQVFEQQNIAPAVTLEGPATVTVRFYPIISPQQLDQASGRLDYSVSYTIDGGSPAQARLSTMSSTATSPRLDLSGLAIGTPGEFTVAIEAGRHVVRVQSPTGFVEVVRAQAPQPAQPPVQQVQQPPVQPPVQQPPAQEESHTFESVRSPFSLNYEGYWLSGPRSSNDSGFVNRLDAMYRHRFNSLVALDVGLSAGWSRATLDSSLASARVDVIDPQAAAGVSVFLGRNTLYALAVGGLEVMRYSLSIPDGRSREATSYGPIYGGRIGYDYNDIFGLSGELTNNHLNPLTVRARVALPYSWVTDARPTLDLSLRLLNSLRPDTSSPLLGTTNLDEKTILLNGNLILPVYRLGPVLPEALLGFRYDRRIDSGTDNAALLLGALLAIDAGSRFRIEAGAGAQMQFAPSFGAGPFMLLNMYYR
ncbi:MAG: hypothetical protein U0R44_06005 [Candidatus Micrarchaeia archaeon]